MKKLFFVLTMLALAVVILDAAEQDTVNRCAAIITQFQQMPEKAIPRDVLRQAKESRVFLRLITLLLIVSTRRR